MEWMIKLDPNLNMDHYSLAWNGFPNDTVI